MSAFDAVIRCHSVAAREALAQEWRSSGDPRADFIENQIDDYKQRYLPGDWMRVQREIDRAIARDGRTWAGRVAELAVNYSFDLGLISTVVVTGDIFVERGADLVGLAPILHLVLDPPIDLVRVVAVPALAQMRTLSVVAGPWINDDAIVHLAASPYVRELRGLDLQGGQLTERGLEALLFSPNLLEKIIYIDLTGNPCCEGLPGGITEVRGHHYLVGRAGVESLAKAYEAASKGYTPDDVPWPPVDTAFSFEE